MLRASYSPPHPSWLRQFHSLSVLMRWAHYVFEVLDVHVRTGRSTAALTSSPSVMSVVSPHRTILRCLLLSSRQHVGSTHIGDA